MGIMFNKGQNYNLLASTFLVPAEDLEYLKKMGANFYLGDNAISLKSPKQNTSTTYTFGCIVGNVINAPTEKDILGVNEFVSGFIALDKLQSLSSIPSEIEHPANSKNGYVSASKLPMCKLRDANKLYQRVYGTSEGSVYRLVAFNSEIKVAIRINNKSLSIRVEGTFSTDLVHNLSTLGFNKKSNDYMSAHYQCDNCSPAQLVGSVLCASTVVFDSPVPNFNLLLEV